MGLFSTKTKVYVASSTWSLAGDPDKLPKILPSLVLSSLISGSNEGIGTALVQGLRSTTFMRSQSFFKWAKDHYDFGMPTASLGADFTVAGRDVGPALRTALGVSGSNKEVEILGARVEELYLGHWAEDWLRRNEPGVDLELDYTGSVGWDVSLNATSEILTITYPGGPHTMSAPADLLWALADTQRKLLYIAYRIHTKNVSTGLWTAAPNQLFTYRMGSGNAKFDTLKPTAQELIEFPPAIPLRLDNDSISEHPNFENVTEAYKKLTGGKLEELLEDLEDNPDIDDMDFIFIVQGVPLNTKSRAGRAYIYRFFKNLKSLQPALTNSSVFITNRGRDAVAGASWSSWSATNNADTTSTTHHPRRGTVPPSASLVQNGDDDRNGLQITMEDLQKYDLRIKWGEITETVLVGNAARFDGVNRKKLKKGAYWITRLPNINLHFPDPAPNGFLQGIYDALAVSRTVILHQYAVRRFRMLTITDLEFQNMIYKDKSVEISAKDALNDEELSGFLVPMHLPTLRQLNAVHRVELTGHTVHLLINSYQEVKRKWYQRGAFKVIVVILIIVIAIVVAGPAGFGASVGILGTNAAVGAALGLTGLTAAVAGAAINAVAAILVTKIITAGSIALFGEKWGSIIAAVIMIVTMQVIAGFHSSGQIAVDWGAMFRIDNLMNLTDAVTSSYATWIQEDTLGLADAVAEAGEEYAEQMAIIKEQTEKILGSTNIAIDATMIGDAAEHFGESSASFLSRTLMTGSDLAQMSNLLIEGFTELTLELPGPL